jgi:hypothetical protein
MDLIPAMPRVFLASGSLELLCDEKLTLAGRTSYTVIAVFSTGALQGKAWKGIAPSTPYIRPRVGLSPCWW